MKIAISSTGKDSSSQIDPRFGRCAYFVVFETDDASFETYDNANVALGGGAGIQSASFLASKGVRAVLTGACGPNAMKVFATANVEVYTDQTGTVKEAVERFQKGGLKPSAEATVPEKAGLASSAGATSAQAFGGGRCAGGAGRGIGMGGGGRGMGGGRRCMGGAGRGMGMGGGMGGGAYAQVRSPDPGTDSLADLKLQAENLRKQMEDIQSKIAKLDNPR